MSEIKLPVIRQFDDYHEISGMNETLRGTGIKVKELNVDSDRLLPYWGIIYTGTLEDEVNSQYLEDFRRRNDLNGKYRDRVHSI